jgi:hypothetical protein
MLVERMVDGTGLASFRSGHNQQIETLEVTIKKHPNGIVFYFLGQQTVTLSVTKA